MNINYQNRHLNMPIINPNYIYIQSKYVTPFYSSPKNTSNFYFNYGMRHYYSAEIKSNSKINHNVRKPIYILNPYYIANQLTNKIYNTNSIYIKSCQIQTNNNTPTKSLNQILINRNIINQNNESQINNKKIIIYNINNDSNINPKINFNQNISGRNTNIYPLRKNIYSYDSYSVKTYNNNKEKITYEQYTNPKNYDYEMNVNKFINQLKDNNIDNNIEQSYIKQSNITQNNIIQNNDVQNNVIQNNSIQNFIMQNIIKDNNIENSITKNNIMQSNRQNNIIKDTIMENKIMKQSIIIQNDNLDNKIQNDIDKKFSQINYDNILENENLNITILKEEEINLHNKTLNEKNEYRKNLAIINPYNIDLYNNKKEEYKISFDNNDILQNKIIYNNPFIMENKNQANNNIKNSINKIDITDNIPFNINDINTKENNNIINYENNHEIIGETFDLNNEINDINYTKSQSETISQINIFKNVYDNFSKVQKEGTNANKVEDKEYNIEYKYLQKHNNNDNLLNNININVNEIQNNEKVNELSNLNISINKNEIKKNKYNVNVLKEGARPQFEYETKKNNKNDKVIEKDNTIKINLNDNFFNNISKDKNKSENEKNEEEKIEINNKDKIQINIIRKKEHNRPVYKIPSSKKRSISQGKSLAFIHKYYDENFILEEDNEENSSDNENYKINKDNINKNMSKKIFKEVKVTKITKSNNNKNK